MRFAVTLLSDQEHLLSKLYIVPIELEIKAINIFMVSMFMERAIKAAFKGQLVVPRTMAQSSSEVTTTFHIEPIVEGGDFIILTYGIYKYPGEH